MGEDRRGRPLCWVSDKRPAPWDREPPTCQQGARPGCSPPSLSGHLASLDKQLWSRQGPDCLESPLLASEGNSLMTISECNGEGL